MPKVSDKLIDVKSRLANLVMTKPGVVGVGIEQDQAGQPVVAVHLASNADRAGLPVAFDGHPIKYRVTGPLKAFDA